jgi:hypothetical protein
VGLSAVQLVKHTSGSGVEVKFMGGNEKPPFTYSTPLHIDVTAFGSDVQVRSAGSQGYNPMASSRINSNLCSQSTVSTEAWTTASSVVSRNAMFTDVAGTSTQPTTVGSTFTPLMITQSQISTSEVSSSTTLKPSVSSSISYSQKLATSFPTTVPDDEIGSATKAAGCPEDPMVHFGEPLGQRREIPVYTIFEYSEVSSISQCANECISLRSSLCLGFGFSTSQGSGTCRLSSAQLQSQLRTGNVGSSFYFRALFCYSEDNPASTNAKSSTEQTKFVLDDVDDVNGDTTAKPGGSIFLREKFTFIIAGCSFLGVIGVVLSVMYVARRGRRGDVDLEELESNFKTAQTEVLGVGKWTSYIKVLDKLGYGDLPPGLRNTEHDDAPEWDYASTPPQTRRQVPMQPLLTPTGRAATLRSRVNQDPDSTISTNACDQPLKTNDNSSIGEKSCRNDNTSISSKDCGKIQASISLDSSTRQHQPPRYPDILSNRSDSTRRSVTIREGSSAVVPIAMGKLLPSFCIVIPPTPNVEESSKTC